MNADTWQFLIGFLGQGLFTMRFVWQWLHSERQRRSVVPLPFWYFSMLGGMTLLLYVIHRRDQVFIAGQFLGVFIYMHNLFLIRQERQAGESSRYGQ